MPFRPNLPGPGPLVPFREVPETPAPTAPSVDETFFAQPYTEQEAGSGWDCSDYPEDGDQYDYYASAATTLDIAPWYQSHRTVVWLDASQAFAASADGATAATLPDASGSGNAFTSVTGPVVRKVQAWSAFEQKPVVFNPSRTGFTSYYTGPNLANQLTGEVTLLIVFRPGINLQIENPVDYSIFPDDQKFTLFANNSNDSWFIDTGQNPDSYFGPWRTTRLSGYPADGFVPTSGIHLLLLTVNASGVYRVWTEIADAGDGSSGFVFDLGDRSKLLGTDPDPQTQQRGLTGYFAEMQILNWEVTPAERQALIDDAVTKWLADPHAAVASVLEPTTDVEHDDFDYWTTLPEQIESVTGVPAPDDASIATAALVPDHSDQPAPDDAWDYYGGSVEIAAAFGRAPATGRFASTVLGYGPRAYWRLGESSGPTAFDAIEGHDGTWSGSPSGFSTKGLAAPDADTAVTFDGVDDFVDVPNHSGLRFDGAQPWSLMAIVNVPVGNPNIASVIVGEFASGTVPFMLGWYDGTGSQQRPSVGFYDGSWHVAIHASENMTLGVDHVVIGTWDGTTLRIYQDGVEKANNTPGASPISSTQRFLLGSRWDNAGGPQKFVGVGDELAVFATALAPADVYTLYSVAFEIPERIAQMSVVEPTADLEHDDHDYWSQDHAPALDVSAFVAGPPVTSDAYIASLDLPDHADQPDEDEAWDFYDPFIDGAEAVLGFLTVEDEIAEAAQLDRSVGQDDDQAWVAADPTDVAPFLDGAEAILGFLTVEDEIAEAAQLPRDLGWFPEDFEQANDPTDIAPFVEANEEYLAGPPLFADDGYAATVDVFDHSDEPAPDDAFDFYATTQEGTEWLIGFLTVEDEIAEAAQLDRSVGQDDDQAWTLLDPTDSAPFVDGAEAILGFLVPSDEVAQAAQPAPDVGWFSDAERIDDTEEQGVEVVHVQPEEYIAGSTVADDPLYLAQTYYEQDIENAPAPDDAFDYSAAAGFVSTFPAYVPEPPQLRYDFDAFTLGLSDGAAVGTWPDASGRGSDAVQPTGGQQPVFVAAGINGHPAVRGDGTDDQMPVTNYTPDWQAWTIMAVVAPEVGDATSEDVIVGGAAPGNSWFVDRSSSVGVPYGSIAIRTSSGLNNLSGLGTGAIWPDRQGKLVTFVYDPAAGRSIYDGLQLVASDADTTHADPPTSMFLFSRGSLFFQGLIGQVRIWNYVLDPATRATEQQALLTKWFDVTDEVAEGQVTDDQASAGHYEWPPDATNEQPWLDQSEAFIAGPPATDDGYIATTALVPDASDQPAPDDAWDYYGVAVSTVEEILVVPPYRQVADTFTRADSTLLGLTEIGDTPWAETVGDWVIASGKLHSDGTASAMASVDLGYLDQYVSIDVDTGTTFQGHVVARMASASTFLIAGWQSGTTGLSLFKRINGTFTSVGGSAATGVHGGRVGLWIEGDLVQVLVNDVTYITYTITDPELRTGTAAGVYTDNVGQLFDNFNASPPSWIVAAAQPAQTEDEGGEYDWEGFDYAQLDAASSLDLSAYVAGPPSVDDSYIATTALVPDASDQPAPDEAFDFYAYPVEASEWFIGFLTVEDEIAEAAQDRTAGQDDDQLWTLLDPTDAAPFVDGIEYLTGFLVSADEIAQAAQPHYGDWQDWREAEQTEDYANDSTIGVEDTTNAPDTFDLTAAAQPDPSIGQDWHLWPEWDYTADQPYASELDVAPLTFPADPDEVTQATQPTAIGQDDDALWTLTDPTDIAPFTEQAEGFIAGPPDAFDTTIATQPDPSMGQDTELVNPPDLSQLDTGYVEQAEGYVAGPPAFAPDAETIASQPAETGIDVEGRWPEWDGTDATPFLDGAEWFIGFTVPDVEITIAAQPSRAEDTAIDNPDRVEWTEETDPAVALDLSPLVRADDPLEVTYAAQLDASAGQDDDQWWTLLDPTDTTPFIDEQEELIAGSTPADDPLYAGQAYDDRSTEYAPEETQDYANDTALDLSALTFPPDSTDTTFAAQLDPSAGQDDDAGWVAADPTDVWPYADQGEAFQAIVLPDEGIAAVQDYGDTQADLEPPWAPEHLGDGAAEFLASDAEQATFAAALALPEPAAEPEEEAWAIYAPLADQSGEFAATQLDVALVAALDLLPAPMDEPEAWAPDAVVLDGSEQLAVVGEAAVLAVVASEPEGMAQFFPAWEEPFQELPTTRREPTPPEPTAKPEIVQIPALRDPGVAVDALKDAQQGVAALRDPNVTVDALKEPNATTFDALAEGDIEVP